MKLIHMYQALGFVFITLFMVFDLNPNMPNKVALTLGASTGVIGVFIGEKLYYIIHD